MNRLVGRDAMDKGRFDAFTFAPVRRVNRTVNALNLVLLAIVCFVAFWAPRAAIGVFIAVTVDYSLPGIFNLRDIDADEVNAA